MATQPTFKFVNLIGFALGTLLLCLLLPPFLIIKFFTFIYSFFRVEDVTGKVILITGASSGIGEHLAYVYARRGACLALAARRENRLLEVAHKARKLGSPKVLIITADISNVDDCERIVNQTINNFGRVDHLVNNAGVISSSMLEEYPDITVMKPLMEINFWGAVYITKFAIPHLKKSKGRIITVSSGFHCMPFPATNLYNASKAAIFRLFETLQVELAPDINVTIVVPGFVNSEMSQGRQLSQDNEMEIRETTRDFLQQSRFKYLMEGADEFAESIVNGVCRGKNKLGQPLWTRPWYFALSICPELVQWILKRFILPRVSKNQGC